MKQALRILELAMILRMCKGYIIRVTYSPHVDVISVRAWKGYTSANEKLEMELDYFIHLNKPDNKKELNEVVEKLESLC